MLVLVLYMGTKRVILYMCSLSAKLYRNYETGMQRQVQKLGAGKTVDGTINIIIDVKEGMEYQYLQ